MSLFRRRPLVTAVLCAGVAWVLAGWWWGPVQSVALMLDPDRGCSVLGLAEDGALVGVERTPRTAEWTVWKRTFPAGARQDIWQTQGVRKEPPADVAFRLQPDGRWLFVSKLGSQQSPDGDPILDLRTGRVYPGQDDGMRWVTPDGDSLLMCDGAGRILVRDLETGRAIGRIDDEWIDAVSPDGRFVAAESQGTIRVWRIGEGGVQETKVKCPAASPPSLRLGTANDGDHQPTCQFSSDSQRFLVFGVRRLDVFELEHETPLARHTDCTPIAVSADGTAAFQRNGEVLDTVSGQVVVETAGLRSELDGVRTQTDGWFICQRGGQLSWWGRGWPGTQFRVGPYTVAISSDNSLQHVGCDLVEANAGRRVKLPARLLPSSLSPGGPREKWALYMHPDRLAFHNEETGYVQVVAMPPVDHTGWRVLTAIALFSGPGFWCWRNRAR